MKGFVGPLGRDAFINIQGLRPNQMVQQSRILLISSPHENGDRTHFQNVAVSTLKAKVMDKFHMQ
jgi:hypothetical protein